MRKRIIWLPRFGLGLVAILFISGGMAAAAVGGGDRPGPSSVMVIEIVDASGSMAAHADALAEAEIRQVRRSLRPGDVYAQIEFASEARVVLLAAVHDSLDVQRIVCVLSDLRSGSGDTSISSGLMKAREIALKHAQGRRIILVLLTDGIQDPPDGMRAETLRMAEVTAWWRNRADVRRMLVESPVKERDRAGLVTLAAALNATRASVQDFERMDLVTREIDTTRAKTAPALGTTSNPRFTKKPLGLIAGGVLFALAAATFLVRRVRPVRTPAPPCFPQEPAAAATEPEEAPFSAAVHAVVTTLGRPEARDLRIPEDAPEGRITIGDTGLIRISGLDGTEVVLEVTPDGQRLFASPPRLLNVGRQDVMVDGEGLCVGSRIELAVGAVAIRLAITRGELSVMPVGPAVVRKRVTIGG